MSQVVVPESLVLSADRHALIHQTYIQEACATLENCLGSATLRWALFEAKVRVGNNRAGPVTLLAQHRMLTEVAFHLVKVSLGENARQIEILLNLSDEGLLWILAGQPLDHVYLLHEYLLCYLDYAGVGS